MQNPFFLLFLQTVIVLQAMAQKNPSDYLILDCGLPKNEYTDSVTGLQYVSDSAYTSAGEPVTAAPMYVFSSRSALCVRSFPHWKRNCYNIPALAGQSYHIYAVFAYFNHDGLNKSPTFELSIGNTRWLIVRLTTDVFFNVAEILHTPARNNISVCLLDIGFGTSFISSLEIIKLGGAENRTNTSVSLVLQNRGNIGSDAGVVVRYPDDLFDRSWYQNYFTGCRNLSTNATIVSAMDKFYPPSKVMRSAMAPINISTPITFITSVPSPPLLLDLYFAELENLAVNQSRVFDVSIDNVSLHKYFSPSYLSTSRLSTINPIYNKMITLTISASDNSTLPPLLNAYELYYMINNTISTEQEDVDALQRIRSMYQISENWEGDPCGPEDYPWQGVNCNYSISSSLVVVSLNLYSSQLQGPIAPAVEDLKNLTILDLSNNKLTGPVPEFLSQLLFLKVLNLSGNNLTGTLPDSLTTRAKAGFLSLNITDNPNLRSDLFPSKKNNKKSVIPMALGVAAALAVAAAIVVAFFFFKKRGNKESAEEKPWIANTKELKYSTILKITNNLDKIIGEGASGKVYRGVLNESPVAVKIISEISSIASGKSKQRPVIY